MADEVPSPQEQPVPETAQLDYLNQRWEGELPDGRFIWLDDKTLTSHAIAWLHKQGNAEPTNEELLQARGYCRQISYWVDVQDLRGAYIQPLPPEQR